MRKRKTTPAAVFLTTLLASAPLAAQTAFDFDRGIDVRMLLQEAAPVPEPPAPAPQQPDPAPRGAGKVTTTRDCAVFRYRAGDAATTAPIAMASRVTQRVCHTYWGKRICVDQPLETVSRSVVFSIRGPHELLPWETEAFSVCLQGSALEILPLAVAHEYGKPEVLATPTRHTVALAAVRKIPTAPDPEGIMVTSFAEESDGVSFAFADKWARQYQGDQTRLIVEVRQDKSILPDPAIFSADISQGAADSYTFYFRDVQRRLRTGAKYYLTWKFQRQGKVSTGQLQPGGRTVELRLDRLHN